MKVSKHVGMYDQLKRGIDNQAAAAAAIPCGSGKPLSHRDAVRSEPSLVSGWLSSAQTAGTILSNGLSSGSSVAPVARVTREELQLIIRSTDRGLVDPLRCREDVLLERANRSIKDAFAEMMTEESPFRLSA